MSVNETLLSAGEYLQSLSMDDKQVIRELYAHDGASIYRITAEHHVIIECTAHPHRGYAWITRNLDQAAWVEFARFDNAADGLAFHHYGPPW